MFDENTIVNPKELPVPLQPEVIHISGRKGELINIPSKFASTTSTPVASNGHRDRFSLNNPKNGSSILERFNRSASAV